MEIIEEEQPNFIELQNELFEEIIHSINEIDNQILSLLAQREKNYTLFKDMCYKYNKLESENNLINTTFTRINNNYPNSKNHIKQIFNVIYKV